MEENEAVKYTLYTVEDILYPLIAGIGILANLLVIVVVTIWEKSRANRTVANMFVVNLAIADLLFLIILPLNMPILVDNGWIYGSILCKLIKAIKYINFRASICFLTTMTVDRYLAIVYSLESRAYRTRSNAIKVCIVLWFLCFLAAIPMFVYTRIVYDGVPECRVEFPGFEPPLTESDLYKEILKLFENQTSSNISTDDYGGLEKALSNYLYGSGMADFSELYDDNDYQPQHVNGTPQTYTCIDSGHENSTSKTAWVYCNFVIFFLIPVIVVIFCYSSIIKAAMSRNIERSNSNGTQHQVSVMVATLVSVFIICWLPFQVFELLIIPPGIQVPYINDCTIIKSTFQMLAWSNSAINPILYSISSKRFRDKVLITWTYIRHGEKRALRVQISQRTIQTRLQTTQGTSLKSQGSTTPVLMRGTQAEFASDNDAVKGTKV